MARNPHRWKTLHFRDEYPRDVCEVGDLECADPPEYEYQDREPTEWLDDAF